MRLSFDALIYIYIYNECFGLITLILLYCILVDSQRKIAYSMLITHAMFINIFTQSTASEMVLGLRESDISLGQVDHHKTSDQH